MHPYWPRVPWRNRASEKTSVSSHGSFGLSGQKVNRFSPRRSAAGGFLRRVLLVDWAGEGVPLACRSARGPFFDDDHRAGRAFVGGGIPGDRGPSPGVLRRGGDPG